MTPGSIESICDTIGPSHLCNSSIVLSVADGFHQPSCLITLSLVQCWGLIWEGRSVLWQLRHRPDQSRHTCLITHAAAVITKKALWRRPRFVCSYQTAFTSCAKCAQINIHENNARMTLTFIQCQHISRGVITGCETALSAGKQQSLRCANFLLWMSKLFSSFSLTYLYMLQLSREEAGLSAVRSLITRHSIGASWERGKKDFSVSCHFLFTAALSSKDPPFCSPCFVSSSPIWPIVFSVIVACVV